MNNQALIDKIKNKNKETGIDKGVLLRFYMYEKFIERLSYSCYKDNFVLKGGFYLSSILGLNNRMTKDIDACLKGQELTKGKIRDIVSHIISIDLNDNISYNIKEIEPIIAENVTGGFRITLLVKINNIKDKFHFDVAPKDVITPKEIKYKYKSVIENKEITVWAYNLETVIAEKLHSILTKQELNSRMKDYYDIYLIKTLNWKFIDKNILRKAIKINYFKLIETVESVLEMQQLTSIS